MELLATFRDTVLRVGLEPVTKVSEADAVRSTALLLESDGDHNATDDVKAIIFSAFNR